MKGGALVHFLKYSLGLESAHTQTTEKERNLISEHATGKTCAVEIGVYEGVNTITIAKVIAAGAKLYGIDPFFKGGLGICYHQLIAQRGLSRHGLQKKVELIPKLSFEAVHLVPALVDFIFIDGDHSYEGIRRDWEDWSGKVKPSGIIALHDTSVPSHDPAVAQLGSYRFYQDVISQDDRFIHLAAADSLNILKRK